MTDKKQTQRKPRPRRTGTAKSPEPPRIIDPQRKQKYSDEAKAAARSLWEADPHLSLREVARETGIPYATISKWSKGGASGKEERWTKRGADMSERAQAAADTFRGKLAELGPEITTEQQNQAIADTAEETAVELRARVLERHRKEWNVPRALVQEAVKARDFNKAKLAKITSETLKIVQDGERKAWGIDSGPDGQTKVQVVIERE